MSQNANQSMMSFTGVHCCSAVYLQQHRKTAFLKVLYLFTLWMCFLLINMYFKCC